MRTFTSIFFAAMTAFTAYAPTAAAETTINPYIGATHDYVAGNIGVELSKGLHPYAGVSIDHSSGFFVEGWAISEPIIGGSDETSIEYEIDGFVGWKGQIAKDLTARFDYAVFRVNTGEVEGDIENLRAFVNWNRDGIQPYARLQYILDDGFGPGKGLAYVVGAKYEQFSVELGGADGPLDQNKFGTFARAKWNSEAIDELRGSSISIAVQKGSDLIGDTVTVGIHKAF